MNIEQAKRQAELVYEASQHLGEAEAQRLYTETLENLLADADDAEDADDADGGVSIADARRAAVISAPTTSAQYSARRPEGAIMNREQQITDYDAWTEYVDPQGIVSEDQFHKMSIKEKTTLIETVFGADATYTDNSADADASAR